HFLKTLNTSSIPVDYVNQTVDTCPYAYIQMQSMTTSSEIHGYLSQSRFTTSKTLCNHSIFCRHLDTLFKTVNFQLKTRQKFEIPKFHTLYEGCNHKHVCPWRWCVW